MRTQRVPGQPMENVVLRMPGEQVRRLKVRAARRPEYLADLLRRYIDAGDMADSMAENNAAYPHPDDAGDAADTQKEQGDG